MSTFPVALRGSSSRNQISRGTLKFARFFFTCAFVVAKGAKKPSEDDLKAHIKKNLANFKVPREIWFLDEMPRNATGKILKRELKEIEKQPS